MLNPQAAGGCVNHALLSCGNLVIFPLGSWPDRVCSFGFEKSDGQERTARRRPFTEKREWRHQIAAINEDAGAHQNAADGSEGRRACKIF
jgi:hypothetical protein